MVCFIDFHFINLYSHFHLMYFYFIDFHFIDFHFIDFHFIDFHFIDLYKIEIQIFITMLNDIYQMIFIK